MPGFERTMSVLPHSTRKYIIRYSVLRLPRASDVTVPVPEGDELGEGDLLLGVALHGRRFGPPPNNHLRLSAAGARGRRSAAVITA